MLLLLLRENCAGSLSIALGCLNEAKLLLPSPAAACVLHLPYIHFNPLAKSKTTFLQCPSSKQGRKTSQKGKNHTSLAAFLHVIVTISWCHHQPWHFIHTEHLWAHHICFSIECIFKCFPGNCFNTICLLGNLVPANAMLVSLVFFLGLPILAYKCHKAGFSISSHTGADLSLHLERLNWWNESCTECCKLANSALVSYQRKQVSKAGTFCGKENVSCN